MNIDTQALETRRRQLPRIEDLYANPEEAAKQNQLNRLLNAEPKKDWIETHPIAKSVRYIPISIIEFLLTAIFTHWRVEIIDTKVIANSVAVTIRLWYVNPTDGAWYSQDGIGAVDIQTEKGAAPTDFTQIKQSAVMKAAPAAKSLAIKDAAECLGRIFGKDLNRKEFLPYTTLDNKFDLDTIKPTEAHKKELWSLLYELQYINSSEKDDLELRIRDCASVAEYQELRMEMTDLRTSLVDRVRNGETMKMGEINAVIAQKINEPE